MRVVFLEVNTERSWALPSVGPSFIAAHLRNHGHEVVLERVALDETAADVAATIDELAPDLIGVSLTTRQWQRGRHLLEALRVHSSTPVVAGGLHPTFSPEVVLSNPGIDFVCLGEGEGPMLDLVHALERGDSGEGIENIWASGGSRPALRMPFEPIDDLPFLARDMLDEHYGVVHMATQRGCPFPCTYCAARMYNQLYKGQAEYGRRRSHGNVLAELTGLRDAGQLSYVIFLDDTFTIHHPWVREFCRVYGDQLGTPFCLHARVETVNEKMLHMLAKAGCKQITYGVESGSEDVRRNVMKRPVTNERFREVFKWTREAGIAVVANYMLGLPGETRGDLEQTVAFAEELEVLDFGYFVFYPYPGTQLFRECRDKGYLPDDYLDRPANHRETILALPSLSQKDVGWAYDQLTDLRRRRYARGAADSDAAAATAHVDDAARTG